MWCCLHWLVATQQEPVLSCELKEGKVSPFPLLEYQVSLATDVAMGGEGEGGGGEGKGEKGRGKGEKGRGGGREEEGDR